MTVWNHWKNLADELLSQGGDIAFPIWAALAIPTGVNFISGVIGGRKEIQEINKVGVIVGLITGAAVGLMYSAWELNYMFQTTETLSQCGTPGEWCKGEITDIVAFMSPVYGAGLSYVHEKMKKKN